MIQNSSFGALGNLLNCLLIPSWKRNSLNQDTDYGHMKAKSLNKYINSDRKWIGQKYTKDFSNKMFRKKFGFLTCILPDYLSHESPKEFWKNSHFENMRADFLGRCLNSLWQTSPEMMHFQAWKKMFLTDIVS